MNNDETIQVDEEIIQEDKEEILSSETDIQDDKTESETITETQEDVSVTIPQENIETTQTIIVDGQELDFYTEMYREIKVNNFILQLILILIPTLFCVTKIYQAIRKMLTVRF